MDDKILKLKEWVDQSDNIVFFGGAGVSTESNIPDFRSVDGLYNQEYDYPPETNLSHTFFMRNPEEFYRFYKNKMLLLDAKPNAAHIKLAELEEQGKLKAVVTQNIDGLHQKAGSRIVHELHCGMLSLTCQKCGGQVPASALDAQLRSGKVVHHEPTCMGVMKPDIVFSGEMLPQDALMSSYKAMTQAELVLVLGTSLAVYPAAGQPSERSRDAELVIINRTATPLDGEATLVFHESIGEILPAAVQGI